MPRVSFRDVSLLNLATCRTDKVFMFCSDMRPHAGFVFLSTAQVEVKYFEIHIWSLTTKNEWKALSYPGSTPGSVSLTDLSKSMEIVMDLP